MLPDYPKFKEKLQRHLINYIRLKQSQFMQPLSDVPRQIIHEGTRSILVREDKSYDEIDIKQFSHELSWKYDDIDKINYGSVLKQCDDVAESMAKQQSIAFYDEISRAVTKIGNEITVSGENYSPKHLFETFKKIWISFDEFDNPIMPTFVAGSNAYEGITKVLNEIETDATLKKELNEIIQIKRIEWRDREARRTLVG